MSGEMTPAERVFRDDVEKGPFQSGVERGRWRLLSIEWPYAVMTVSAAERPNSPQAYGLRFELTNYPQALPTAQPWDVEKNAPLEHARWPFGRLRVPAAFNPGWKGGTCLYLPCDRLSIEGHDGWRNKHPSMIWSPNGDITQYLRIVHDLLNSSDYTGTRSA